jgi:predicted nucleic acid-binding protein
VKIFLDANVLIDLIDDKRKNHQDVIKLFNKIIDYDLYTSCDIITTIYYISRKIPNILEYIQKIIYICDIVPFGSYDSLEVIKLMKEDKQFIDLEDSIQYYLSWKMKVDYIITNDKNFYSPKIKKLTIQEALKSI